MSNAAKLRRRVAGIEPATRTSPSSEREASREACPRAPQSSRKDMVGRLSRDVRQMFSRIMRPAESGGPRPLPKACDRCEWSVSVSRVA